MRMPTCCGSCLLCAVAGINGFIDPHALTSFAVQWWPKEVQLQEVQVPQAVL